MSRDPTEALIGALARSAVPVRPLPPLRWQLARVVALAAAVSAFVVAGLGLRAPGASALLTGSPQLWMALGLAGAGLGGVTASLAFARPGRESDAVTALVVALVALLVAVLASTHVVAWTSPLHEPLWLGAAEIPCIVTSLLFSLPAALFVTWLVSRGAPLRRLRTVVVAAGGTTALGAFAAHLICRTPGDWHVVLAHALEPFAGALLLAPALYALLRFWQRAR